MKRASRPKQHYVLTMGMPRRGVWVVLVTAVMLLPLSVAAQSPVASSFATKDGRAATVILGCPTTNSTYFAEFCGVAGFPLHVTVDSGTVTVNGATGGSTVPTTAPGTASSSVIGVQGVGSSGIPIPVTLGTMPLAAGAAVSSLQPQLDADGGSWAHITNFPSQAALNSDGGRQVHVQNFPTTQAITAATLPLPSGAAVSALQSALNADGGSIVHVQNFPTSQTITGSVSVSALPALPAGTNAIGAVSVSNLPSTQAVSGTVSVSNLPATQAVSVASLPLPAGAATAAQQPAISSDGGSQVHVQNFPTTQAVSGTVSVSSLPALPAGTNAIGSVTVSNWPASSGGTASSVAVTSLPALPAGTNAIGGVTVSNFPTTQPVTGSVSVTNYPTTQAVSAASLPLPAGAATAALQSALNADGGSQVHVQNFPSTQTVSGSVSVSALPVLPAGTNAIGSVTVSNLPNTQAVSAASLPLPAGAATAALQPALNGDGGSQVHVQNFPTTQAVSAASLPLPAGAATSALQPVLNSDGGSQVHVQNFPNTQAISAATLPLPAGAATAALQSAVNADGGSQVHVQNFPSVQPVRFTTVPQAGRSGAWIDASVTATSTASVPSGLAAVASRVGLHVWNVGSSTACFNYTSTATASGTGCAAGSIPVPAGSAYLEDQPGNVSPEAISVVCAGTSCPLTIKVR